MQFYTFQTNAGDGIDVLSSFQQASIFDDAVCLRLRLKAKLVARVVLVGMRLRGKVIRSQREQVVAAYYSPPPHLSPAEVSLLQWQRSKVSPGERLLPRGHRHSSIPLWSKLEPTGPLPGDQWSVALSKFKVSCARVCTCVSAGDACYRGFP